MQKGASKKLKKQSPTHKTHLLRINKLIMSSVVFDPIDWKKDGGLFAQGKINKLENNKKSPIYEKTNWIFEQYPNTPSAEYTSENDGNYLSINIYPDQEACKTVEAMFDTYDASLREQMPYVLGDERLPFYKVKPTLNFPVPKIGIPKDPSKPVRPSYKKTSISIEAKNVVYYQDKPLDKNNMTTYFETKKTIYSIPNLDKRKAAADKLVFNFKFPDEVTKVMTEVQVPACELDVKKEYSDLVVKHRSVNSIPDGTKKPHECKSAEELEQIYGKADIKTVKNFIELKKLMGFNGYRRYVFFPKETQAETTLKADEKSKLKIKWFVGCIDIIQVKGNSFENRRQNYDDLLSDYGSGESKPTAVDGEEDGDEYEEDEVEETTEPVKKPVTAKPAPATKQPVVKQPVVKQPIVVDNEEDDDDDDGDEEDGEEEDDDEVEAPIVVKTAPPKKQAVVPPPAPTPAPVATKVSGKKVAK